MTIIVKNILVLACVMLMVSGCFSRNFTGVSGRTLDDGTAIFVPKRAFVRGLPEGDDSYSQGFRAGCVTNSSLVGAGSMKLLHERIEPERLANDKLYLRGYMDGGGYCNDRLDWEGH